MAYIYRCAGCGQCYIRGSLETEPEQQRRCLKCGPRTRFLTPPSGPPGAYKPLRFGTIPKSDSAEGHQGA